MKRAARALVAVVLAAGAAQPAWRLGILDGFVALWEDGAVAYRSAVPAVRLPQADRAALQAGLFPAGRAELSRMQEDFLH